MSDEERDRKIMELHEIGLSHAAIAKQVGTNKGLVAKIIRGGRWPVSAFSKKESRAFTDEWDKHRAIVAAKSSEMHSKKHWDGVKESYYHQIRLKGLV